MTDNNSQNSQKQIVHPVVKQFAAIRKMKNISVQEVAELTGISKSSITKWEAGWRSPNLKNLSKLAHAVGGEIGIIGW